MRWGGRGAPTVSLPPLGRPWRGSVAASFLGRVPRSAAAWTRGRLRGVPWSALHRPNTEVRPGSLRGGAEGRRSQTSPALPARRAVSTAGFPGAAEGRRARSAGREGASEPRRSAVEPGPSTDLAFPPRLAQQRDPRAARPRGRQSPPRAARCSPFPGPRVFFPLFDFFPPNLPFTGVPPPAPQISLGARKSPAAAPSRHTRAAGRSLARGLSLFPLPLTTECANEKGGGRYRRQRCRRHYPLLLRCTDVAVVLSSHSTAACRYRGDQGFGVASPGSRRAPQDGGLGYPHARVFSGPRPYSPKGVAGGRRGSRRRN